MNKIKKEVLYFPGPADLGANLLGLVSGVGVVGELESDKEAEMILSSVCSLIVAVTPETAVLVVEEFCKQLCSETFRGIGWASNVRFLKGPLALN